MIIGRPRLLPWCFMDGGPSGTMNTAEQSLWITMDHPEMLMNAPKNVTAPIRGNEGDSLAASFPSPDLGCSRSEFFLRTF